MAKIIKKIQSNSLSEAYIKALSQDEAEKIYTSLLRIDSTLAELFSEKWSEWHEYHSETDYQQVLKQFM